MTPCEKRTRIRAAVGETTWCAAVGEPPRLVPADHRGHLGRRLVANAAHGLGVDFRRGARCLRTLGR